MLVILLLMVLHHYAIMVNVCLYPRISWGNPYLPSSNNYYFIKHIIVFGASDKENMDKNVTLCTNYVSRIYQKKINTKISQ